MIKKTGDAEIINVLTKQNVKDESVIEAWEKVKKASSADKKESLKDTESNGNN